MFSFKNQVPVISAPRIGILDFGGEETKEFVRSDFTFLKALFTDVRLLELSALKCDVLFIYGELTADGGITGSFKGLRELIRDSGAKVVIVASANPSEYYIKAGKPQPYGRANLVMTLDRRGDSFARFFFALFSKMKNGASMTTAWVALNPQVSGQTQLDCPETIFACEVGPLTFS